MNSFPVLYAAPVSIKEHMASMMIDEWEKIWKKVGIT